MSVTIYGEDASGRELEGFITGTEYSDAVRPEILITYSLNQDEGL